MWMKGSRTLRSTPANARCTGKPSPSKPRGAVVTEATGRSRCVTGSSIGMRGRVSGLSTVTAGMVGLLSLERARTPHYRCGVNDLCCLNVVASSTIPGRLAGMTMETDPAPATAASRDTRWLNDVEEAAWRAYLDGTRLLMHALDHQLATDSDLSLTDYDLLVRLSEAP